MPSPLLVVPSRVIPSLALGLVGVALTLLAVILSNLSKVLVVRRKAGVSLVVLNVWAVFIIFLFCLSGDLLLCYWLQFFADDYLKVSYYFFSLIFSACTWLSIILICSLKFLCYILLGRYDCRLIISSTRSCKFSCYIRSSTVFVWFFVRAVLFMFSLRARSPRLKRCNDLFNTFYIK